MIILILLVGVDIGCGDFIILKFLLVVGVVGEVCVRLVVRFRDRRSVLSSFFML